MYLKILTNIACVEGGNSRDSWSCREKACNDAYQNEAMHLHDQHTILLNFYSFFQNITVNYNLLILHAHFPL